MLQKQLIYHLHHDAGTHLAGEVWPVIYRGIKWDVSEINYADGTVEVKNSGLRDNFIYLQSTHIGDFRLAQVFVEENNIVEDGKNLTILHSLGVSYGTGERGLIKALPFIEYWSSLSRLVFHHWLNNRAPFKPKNNVEAYT